MQFQITVKTIKGLALADWGAILQVIVSYYGAALADLCPFLYSLKL